MKNKIIDQIIDDIIRREGGYVNHPADKGGPTKYGITLKTLSEYRGKPCTENDVKALTKAVAASIYYQRYYLAPNIDSLPVDIQPVVLDMAVNMGPSRAIRLLQQALDGFVDDPIDVDGVIGLRTINAATSVYRKHARKLTQAITDERIKFYRRIVANNPSQSVFLAGWINRANEFV